MKRPVTGDWQGLITRDSKSWECGYCGNKVASREGWWQRDPRVGQSVGEMRICPQCNGPTFFYSNVQMPGASHGSPVNHLPPEIAQLYEEARAASSANAPTATVMCCRKILMHVAVDKGAEEGASFQDYVNYLNDKHYIPAGASVWVDKIRDWGNEANHEIKLKTAIDATKAIDFTEMLLKVVYEYPGEA